MSIGESFPDERVPLDIVGFESELISGPEPDLAVLRERIQALLMLTPRREKHPFTLGILGALIDSLHPLRLIFNQNFALYDPQKDIYRDISIVISEPSFSRPKIVIWLHNVLGQSELLFANHDQLSRALDELAISYLRLSDILGRMTGWPILDLYQLLNLEGHGPMSNWDRFNYGVPHMHLNGKEWNRASFSQVYLAAMGFGLLASQVLSEISIILDDESVQRLQLSPVTALRILQDWSGRLCRTRSSRDELNDAIFAREQVECQDVQVLMAIGRAMLGVLTVKEIEFFWYTNALYAAGLGATFAASLANPIFMAALVSLGIVRVCDWGILGSARLDAIFPHLRQVFLNWQLWQQSQGEVTIAPSIGRSRRLQGVARLSGMASRVRITAGLEESHSEAKLPVAALLRIAESFYPGCLTMAEWVKEWERFIVNVDYQTLASEMPVGAQHDEEWLLFAAKKFVNFVKANR